MSLSTEMSPADLVAVTGGNNNHGSMWGNDGFMWIVILFLFAFAGGGWGNFGGNGAGAQPNYVLTSDFAQVERKLDGISNGLCDGFYTQAQLVNGAQMQMANGFAQAELSRANGQMNTTNQLFGISTALQNCCCENREAIAGVNYNLAQQSCDTRNVVQNGFRDVIDSGNANTRAILDALNAQAIAAKDARIAEQAQKINALELSASQSMQNQYLISQLRPAPVPSFNVPAPYQYGNCGGGCCGC